MPNSDRRRLRITLLRPGLPEECLDHYYVIGHKPAGGLSLRVLMPEHFELDAGDTLLFDFTSECMP
jgi:hypothetical protein